MNKNYEYRPNPDAYRSSYGYKDNGTMASLYMAGGWLLSLFILIWMACQIK